MNASPELLGQNVVYHAVARDTGFSSEHFRHNPDAEMAFAFRVASGMACMLIAFVNDIKYDGLESCFEFLLERLTDRA